MTREGDASPNIDFHLELDADTRKKTLPGKISRQGHPEKTPPAHEKKLISRSAKE